MYAIFNSQKLHTGLPTPPRPSEISMKNWRAKVKPVLTSNLRYKAMLKVLRKSWEPFRINKLNEQIPFVNHQIQE